MLKNKQGQIFSMWLVFITLTMMGVVLGFFYMDQQEITGSIISPMNVFNERDALEVFEGKEINLIRNSLNVATGGFGSNAFHDSFRFIFINGIDSDEEMKQFLFSNLSIDDIEVRERDKNLNLIENGIYPKIRSTMSTDSFVFSRVSVGKKYSFSSGEDNKINFLTKLNFEFDRTYLISKNTNNKYIVKVLGENRPNDLSIF